MSKRWLKFSGYLSGSETIVILLIGLYFLVRAGFGGEADGFHLENVAGLVPAPIDRSLETNEFTGQQLNPNSLYSSKYQPVWGYLDGDKRFWPILVDGHIGALSFYPFRLLNEVAGLFAVQFVCILLGLFTLSSIYLIARNLVSRKLALVALLLAATSPPLLLLHSSMRIDGLFATLGLLAGTLCFQGYRRRKTFGWIFFSALFYGCSIAAKNTASWFCLGIIITLVLFRYRLALSPKRWLLVLLAGIFPLLPQLLFLILQPENSAFSNRVPSLSYALHLLSPERISFFCRHFVETFGYQSTYLLSDHSSGESGNHPVTILGTLTGVVQFVLLIIGIWGALTQKTNLTCRLFASVLGLFLLGHLGFYYMSQHCFQLVTPFVPVVVVLGFHYTVEKFSVVHGSRKRAFSLLLVGGFTALFVFQNITETVLWARSYPVEFPALSQNTQISLSDELIGRNISYPWVTTYTLEGVLETLSENRIQPKNLHSRFWKGHCRSRPPESAVADWVDVFLRAPPGTYFIVFSPNAHFVEISPCKTPSTIRDGFEEAVLKTNSMSKTVWKSFGQKKKVVFELVQLVLVN